MSSAAWRGLKNQNKFEDAGMGQEQQSNKANVKVHNRASTGGILGKVERGCIYYDHRGQRRVHTNQAVLFVLFWGG